MAKLKKKHKVKRLIAYSSLPVVVASLCCLSPVILVLLGISTVGFASSLADQLYGEWKWYFRGVGLGALVVAAMLYLRRAKGVCTFDQAKRRRNEVINVVALFLIVGVVGYILFLYVFVHIIGALLGLWPF